MRMLCIFLSSKNVNATRWWTYTVRLAVRNTICNRPSCGPSHMDLLFSWILLNSPEWFLEQKFYFFFEKLSKIAKLFCVELRSVRSDLANCLNNFSGSFEISQKKTKRSKNDYLIRKILSATFHWAAPHLDAPALLKEKLRSATLERLMAGAWLVSLPRMRFKRYLSDLLESWPRLGGGHSTQCLEEYRRGYLEYPRAFSVRRNQARISIAPLRPASPHRQCSRGRRF